LDIARCLGADICCDFSNEHFRHLLAEENIGLTELGRSVESAALRLLSGMRHFSRPLPLPSNFDWAVFSGVTAPLAVHQSIAQKNLYYCHTPPRFAYDLLDYYLQAMPRWQRPALRALAAITRVKYAAAMEKMDVVIANSENVKQRLSLYLGLEAVVAPPPCDTQRFQWLGQENYYLSTARLEPYKRVDLIVDAFLKMPDMKLVVASGGSQLESLKHRAAGASNIHFTGWTDSKTLHNLVGNCIATIYIPIDEDFGMSPVESMAAGKPVIGVAEGGLLETVLDGQTGILLHKDLRSENITDGVHQLTVKTALSMRYVCERHAHLFSKDCFAAEMKKYI
jgi:glycosyltransferase involved in cell wall biosynthesis